MLSVIIPIYNETQIAIGIKRTIGVLEKAEIPYEIILVDDGSKNNSWNEITDLTSEYDTITAIALSRNFGKESALCAGLDNARGACCVCIDSDMQHPPEVIPEMYRLWRDEGYEVVEGVKNARIKENPVYRLCANGFYKILKKMSDIDLQNASDFRLLDRAAIEAWKSMPEKETFFRGMSSWIGFRRTKVYFDVAEREIGTSKWSLKSLTRLAVNAITSYSSVPLYFASCFGVMFLAFFIIMIAQTLYMKLSGHAQSGFTTVIILQLIIGSITMINIGITGIYIKKIYEEVKGRPRYIIKRIVRGDKKNDNF
ncbi:MAG: glycosyltransferase family 2 protein [Oscillospiraceae bacterium]|nr:glycosyltransferase family 2 protein [Oscillospiraceae bacterium]